MSGSRFRTWALPISAAVAALGVAGASLGQGRERPAGDDVADLRRATEGFIASADRADAAAIAATYDPDFTCVRVADEGGFARLSREQMLGFFNRPGGAGAAPGHAIPTKETTVHHAEAIGDMGFVLLTRVKDLGKGWEPMFYSLVWQKRDGRWRLLREFVHQRSIPKWR